MKRASGIVEIALIMCFVVAISFVMMNVFNNQKAELAKKIQVTKRVSK